LIPTQLNFRRFRHKSASAIDPSRRIKSSHPEGTFSKIQRREIRPPKKRNRKTRLLAKAQNNCTASASKKQNGRMDYSRFPAAAGQIEKARQCSPPKGLRQAHAQAIRSCWMVRNRVGGGAEKKNKKWLRDFSEYEWAIQLLCSCHCGGEKSL